MQRSTFIHKSAILVAVLLVVMAAVIVAVMRGTLRAAAYEHAEADARALTELMVQPHLVHDGGAGGLADPSGLRLPAEGVEGLTVYDTAGRIIYSDQRSLVGMLLDPPPELVSALTGTLTSKIVEGGEGSAFAVFVPMRSTPQGQVVGVSMVEMDLAHMSEGLSDFTRRMTLIVGVGVALVCAVLFGMVAKTSTQLRQQAFSNQRKSEENRWLAHYDNLTGLANREQFAGRARQVVMAAQLQGRRAAMMLIDLNRFKEINDSLGHRVGDLLLREVGARLRGQVGEHDLVARLGGDEFALLYAGIEGPMEAVSRAGSLLQVLQEPYDVEGLTLAIEAGIGIACAPEHGDDAAVLMQRADTAMYVAKDAHTGYAVYDPAKDPHSPERVALLGDLRGAIDAGQLVLHYQPKLDLQTGTVTGVEALVRWQHPTRGLLPPDQFVCIAEQTGLMKPLTLWVLDAAVKQAKEWRDAGHQFSVAVNVSARSLLDEELPSAVAEALRRWAVPPDDLVLELTESTVMVDPSRAQRILERLRGLGTRLAIDDYGTGHSSLAYLQRLPVNELKIDKSFVMAMEHDEASAVIVRSTIELGRSLGLRVVAEGVESAGALARLAELRCHTAQGFHISRPVPAADFLTAVHGDHPQTSALVHNT